MSVRDTGLVAAAASDAPNRLMLRKLVTVVVVMFAFGFALVPFYEKICQATGIRNLLQPDQATPVNTRSIRHGP